MALDADKRTDVQPHAFLKLPAALPAVADRWPKIGDDAHRAAATLVALGGFVDQSSSVSESDD